MQAGEFPPSSEIPTSPGVYRWMDARGRIIYVGKANNLRSRLTSYFVSPDRLHPRTAKMVATAASLTWVVVASEVEALTLEYTWIKEYDPKFNVLFRDDKSYPYFAVTMNQEFPRMGVLRTSHQRGVRYFGPYTAVWALRQTLDLLETVFPLRTCSDGVFAQAKSLGRACLKGDIGRCSAPCVGRISAAEHRVLAEKVCDFMAGRDAGITKAIEEEMWQASQAQDFETAAAKRDQLTALSKVLEKNAVVLSDDTDADLFALAADELQVSVQVFYIRAGRIRGQRGWVSAREEDLDEAALMAAALEQIYGEQTAVNQPHSSRWAAPVSSTDKTHLDTSAIPREILVSHVPARVTVLASWLSALSGTKVEIRRPQRGAKHEAVQRVTLNAQEALRLYKTRRASDLTARNLALNVLGQTLGIDPPLRIECYDISHTYGTNQVASMVVFEDGAPRKNAYRKFTIRGNPEGHSDDTAAMSEVLTRRFRHLLTEEAQQRRERENAGSDPAALHVESDSKVRSEPKRFSYRPDLIVVDGGIPQVNAAREAMDSVGAWDIPVVGLAKRLEEVWVPGDDAEPIVFPRTSQALYLLQYLRDEAHRFAITTHRKKRTKAMQRSKLDEIPGLGPVRQKKLLRHFGSLARLKAADAEAIAQVDGFGIKTAQKLVSHLNNL